MRKLIMIVILALSSLSSRCQFNSFFIDTQINDSIYTLIWQYNNPPIQSLHTIYAYTDTTKLDIYMDSLRVDGLGNRSDGPVMNIAWIDNTGSLMRSDLNDLSVSWSSITGAPTIPTNTNQLTNGAGFITGINSAMVVTALGYTPLSAEVDGNISNEGSLTVDAGTSTTSIINSNTSGSTGVTISAGSNIAVSESGNTITISATGVGSGTVTSVGLTSSDLSVSGSPITSSGNITANLTTTGVSAGTYDWVTVDTKGRVTAGANSPVPTAIAAGARNFNQAYQLSATRPARITVSAQISCNLSLTSGQSGQAILEISPNGTSGWIYCGQISGSNTGTLTIGLNTTQVTGAQLIEDLPAGYYWRLRTNNITGTPTYTFQGGNERIY